MVIPCNRPFSLVDKRIKKNVLMNLDQYNGSKELEALREWNKGRIHAKIVRWDVPLSKIDKPIRPIIAQLKRLGVKTRISCAGHSLPLNIRISYRKPPYADSIEKAIEESAKDSNAIEITKKSLNVKFGKVKDARKFVNILTTKLNKI